MPIIVATPRLLTVVHFEVTENPTQAWFARQMTEAFPWETAPRYLLRDRDASYDGAFRYRIKAMGIKEVVTPHDRPGTSNFVRERLKPELHAKYIFEQGQRETVPQSVPVTDLISAKYWSEREDLNLRPPRPERGALPG